MTTPTEAAIKVADHLLGTCGDVGHTLDMYDLDPGLALNSTFCYELDARVMCCECCGWWVETHEIGEDGECLDCSPEEE